MEKMEKTIAVRVPDDLWYWLQEQARKENRPIGNLVRVYIEAIKKEKEHQQ